jgi:hypothetical protein
MKLNAFVSRIKRIKPFMPKSEGKVKIKIPATKNSFE